MALDRPPTLRGAEHLPTTDGIDSFAGDDAVRIHVTGAMREPGPIAGFGMIDGQLRARHADGTFAKMGEPPPPLVATTGESSNAAQALVRHIRAAHAASCENGGPMELLLRKALADAMQLSQDLDQLARFAAEGRGA